MGHLDTYDPMEKLGGNGNKAYQCVVCDSLITYSDRLITIQGSDRHLFVNPHGIECDFHTFSSCPGAVAVGEGTEEYSWFVGYQWRMAFCKNCGAHLGWHYEAISQILRPLNFWGILISNIHSE